MLLDKYCLKNYMFIFLLYMPVVTWGASINDPTKPIYSAITNSSGEPAPVVIPKKEMLLQSIFFSKQRKIAVVNGELFKEGEHVDGVLVQSIHEDYITVVYKDNSVKLMLSKKLYLDEVTGSVSE